jgi:hypothetical protein
MPADALAPQPLSLLWPTPGKSRAQHARRLSDETCLDLGLAGVVTALVGPDALRGTTRRMSHSLTGTALRSRR